MDPNQLLSRTVEMGLDLLEKNGDFLPFAIALDGAGERVIYTPGSESDETFTKAQAYDSVRTLVARDLAPRGLFGVAFCFHSRIRFADSDEKTPAVEVELHYRGQPAAVWYFLYRMEGAKAEVLNYHTNEANVDLFRETPNADT
jgi:hypothetical protein